MAIFSNKTFFISNDFNLRIAFNRAILGFFQEQKLISRKTELAKRNTQSLVYLEARRLLQIFSLVNENQPRVFTESKILLHE